MLLIELVRNSVFEVPEIIKKQYEIFFLVADSKRIKLLLYTLNQLDAIRSLNKYMINLLSEEIATLTIKKSNNIPQTKSQVDYIIDKVSVLAPYYFDWGEEFHCMFETFYDTIIQWSIYRNRSVQSLDSYLENRIGEEGPFLLSMTIHQFGNVLLPFSVRRSLDSGNSFDVKEIMQLLLGE